MTSARAVRWVSIAASLFVAGCSGANAGDDLLGPGSGSSSEQTPASAAPASSDAVSKSETSEALERRFVADALRFGAAGPKGAPAPPSIDPDPGHPDGTLPSTPPTEAEWFAPPYAWGPGLGFTPPVAPIFWPTWTFAGTLAYTGGTQGFAVPLGAAPTTHFIIEAPASCAPTLTQATAWVWGSHVAVTLSFAGQRIVGGLVQALLRVGLGATVVLSEVDFVFASAFFVSCPIGVYVVRVL